MEPNVLSCGCRMLSVPGTHAVRLRPCIVHGSAFELAALAYMLEQRAELMSYLESLPAPPGGLAGDALAEILRSVVRRIEHALNKDGIELKFTVVKAGTVPTDGAKDS